MLVTNIFLEKEAQQRDNQVVWKTLQLARIPQFGLAI